MSRARFSVLNYLLFNAGYLACLWGAANARPWLGPIAAAAVLAVHFALSPDRRGDARTVFLATLIGPWCDTALAWSGALEFTGGMSGGVFAPVWIVALWSLFAMTFPYCLKWVSGDLRVAFFFGLFGSPLSYKLGGEAMGAAVIAPGWAPLAMIGVFWAVTLPLIFALDRRLREALTLRLPPPLINRSWQP
jgi:hypothetical protein